MNFPYFLAKKVAFASRRSFSAVIIRLAIIAVALSVCVMIVTTGLVTGFKNTITEKIFGFWGHIHIEHFDSNRSFESIPLDINQPFYPHLDTIKSVSYLGPYSLFGVDVPYTKVERQTLGGIRHIQAYASKAGIIKTKNQLEGIILKGIGNDFDWTFLKDFIVKGDLLSFEDSTMSKSILISEQTAKRLQLDIGDKFTVHFVERVQIIKQFIVKGFYRTGLEEYDRKFALVDIRQIQDLNNWQPNEVSGFEVFLDNIRDLDALWGHIYYRQLPTTVFATTLREVYPTIFGWLELQDTNEIVIIALMVIICFINMTTVLLILILERTNMIGVLKALGSTNWNIQKLFLYYAGYILTSGLFWGNLVGISLCLLQQYFGFVTLPEESYYVKVAPVELNIGSLLLLNIGTLLLNLLVLIIPSYLVTRITPVKAIRFK